MIIMSDYIVIDYQIKGAFLCGEIPYLNAEEGESHSSGRKPSLNVPPSSHMVRLANF